MLRPLFNDWSPSPFHSLHIQRNVAVHARSIASGERTNPKSRAAKIAKKRNFGKTALRSDSERRDSLHALNESLQTRIEIRPRRTRKQRKKREGSEYETIFQNEGKKRYFGPKIRES